MTLSSRIYSGILLLYPADLRRDFGPEIHELFAEDLADARHRHGLSGIIGIWWCAVCEVLRIALPGLGTNPKFSVPVISFAFNVLTLSCELAGAMSRHPLPPNGSLLEDLLAFVFLPSLVTGLTAIAVVHAGKVKVVSLKLNS